MSQYERRAARQRQLAQMEAEASGTQASMQLNTGGPEDDGRFVSMRQRNQETARRFLYDEDEGVQTTATVKNTTTAANLFGREEPGMEGVNLMDHETGIYTQQDNSLTGRIRRFFFGPDQGPGEHDAIAADSEVYLGDRASRSSSIIVRLRTLLCSTKQRAIVCFIVFFALLSVAFYSIHTMRRSGMSDQEILFSENSARFRDIWDVITLEGVSDPNALSASTTPQARALRWIAYSDEARLEPSDPMLVQRYSLAVFFFNSFMAFARHSGTKQTIEKGKDDQYQGIPVAGWYIQDYWMSEKGYCSWYGVECQARQEGGIQVRQYDDNANIYALNLTYNYVWGAVPDEIKGLQPIERMDLSRNRLTGSFPGEVRRLSNLRILKLQDNKLSGSLPPEIGFMQSAVEIDITNNGIRGSVPTEINRLTNLQIVKFAKNSLTSQLPSIRSLSNLRYLHLNENDLTGTVPFTIVEVPELREVYLEKNRIGGTLPPELQTLSKLRIFSVHNNNLEGEFPNGLFRSNLDLEYLSIQFNKFTGSIPTRAGTLSKLHTLQMHDNLLTGKFPTEWTAMDSLEILHLQNNKMHGQIPTTIGKLKKVKELWLNNNNITGPLPVELNDCTALELAYFDHNLLDGKLPELGQMKNLNTLRLEGNSITGSVPQPICDLKSFKLRFISADCKSDLTCPDSCCSKCF